MLSLVSTAFAETSVPDKAAEAAVAVPLILPSTGSDSVVQLIGLLTGLFILFFVGAYLFRRFIPAFSFKDLKGFKGLKGLNGGRGIILKERIFIGNRQTIMIVEVRGKEFLLGATEHNIRLLAEIKNDGQTFQEILSNE